MTPTPLCLTRYISDLINVRGPISVAHYMRLALTHPTLGYYASSASPSAIFGPRGDFITAPDISSLVGELSCAWHISTWWASINKPNNDNRRERGGCGHSSSSSSKGQIEIIELGPGNATLLCDVIKTLVRFSEPRDALARVTLVECSPRLREAQLSALLDTRVFGDIVAINDDDAEKELGRVRVLTESGAEIVWEDSLANVIRNSASDCANNDVYRMVLAHEFFDAMPIHQFTRTKHGWRELLVSNNNNNNKTNTNVNVNAEGVDVDVDSDSGFCYVVAPGATPSLALLEMTHGGSRVLQDAPTGTVIEVSPDAISCAQDIATYISRASRGGAALVADYSSCSSHRNSLRGISRHRFVPPLADCGKIDLSADVDFAALRAAVTRVLPHAHLYGPVTQREFMLNMMGGKVLINEEQKSTQATHDAHARLLDVSQMGGAYKWFGVSL